MFNWFRKRSAVMERPAYVAPDIFPPGAVKRDPVTGMRAFDKDVALWGDIGVALKPLEPKVKPTIRIKGVIADV